ncbi:MAG: amino acid permease [Solirubrobacterales bacterium]
MATKDSTSGIRDADEKLLAELGYKQELHRGWSGFSNFAISFSIISVLAGCFTAYAFAWNSGGPVAISIGWPLVALLILIIGLSLAELVAKYPTSGGIYWFAGKLGGPVWAWFTGWFNLIGLIGVVASVQYACAGFMSVLLGLYSVNIFGVNFADTEHILKEIFLLFVIILIVTAIINIFRTHLLAVINNISVWWHVLGVAVIIAILVLVPDNHQSASFVFSTRLNNSGLNGGTTSGLWFFLYLLPIGFLLTQYTITGFDASAHLSEETHGASRNAARGVWQSIFYSAIIGWFVLLAITFAVQDPANISSADNGFGAGSSLAVFSESLSTAGFKAVLFICTVGQLFCGLACLTSASRMGYAFSRDRGMPGSKYFAKVNEAGVPFNSVMGMAALALIITIPALWGAPGTVLPVAFLAVVSICVIGLYIAFAIPIFLRWRMGNKFEQADSWNLGNRWKWMNPVSVIWITIICIAGLMPTNNLAVPWIDGFDWTYVNYAPLILIPATILIALGWIRARSHFTGQERTVDETGYPHQTSAP